MNRRISLLDRIDRRLDENHRQGLHRVIAKPVVHGVDFATNSYLCLQAHDSLHRRAAMLAQGDFSGNLASRLVSTSTDLYESLESILAEWKGCESALVFNSGYAANLGVLQALCSRDTAVFCDRLNHASLLDGVRLSGAKMIRYPHNDIDDLRRRLQAHQGAEKLIVTDTVFSMDGDIAPLEDICELGRANDCMVMVDEAHATGLFGERGSGMVEHKGCEAGVHVRIGTLSKAVAGLGGFFAGDTRLRDYLVNSARSLIYSTALPCAVLAWDIAAVEHIRRTPHVGRTVLEKASLLRKKLGAAGLDTANSCTQIVPCLFGDNQRVVRIGRMLRERGVRVPAIRSPTVPRGTERLRFSVHAGISREQIEETVEALGESCHVSRGEA